MVGAYLGRRLRHLIGQFHVALDPDSAALPDIANALRALEAAVDGDLPRWDDGDTLRRKKGRQRALGQEAAAQTKSLRNRLRYARLKSQQATAALRRLKRSKDADRSQRIGSLFVAKVALASPLQSGRAFEAAWSDLVGTGAVGCSRRTIQRIRDAFCSVLKDLYFRELGAACRSKLSALALASASTPVAALAPGPAVCLLHFHDEELAETQFTRMISCK